MGPPGRFGRCRCRHRAASLNNPGARAGARYDFDLVPPATTPIPHTQAELDAVQFDADGLVPAIVQDVEDRHVLLVGWMNREALAETVKRNEAGYWSRSRGRLWRKGEESGHVQKVREVRIDCDADAVLLLVDQVGGIACHTGHARCFFRKLENGRWVEVEPVLKDPSAIYKK